MRRRALIALSVALLAACSDDKSPASALADAGADPQDAAPDADPRDGADPGLEDVALDADDPRDDVGEVADVDPDAPQESGDAAMDAAEDAEVDPGLGSWASAAPIGVGPRQEVAVVALQGEVLVIGGFNEALQVVPTVEAYDPAMDTWRSLPPMPARMHHANAAVVGDRLYVVGFLTGLGFVPDGRVFVYDPEEEEWSEGASMPTGTERGASGAAAIGSKVYVAGGLRGNAVVDFSAYDTGADSWEALAPLPVSLDHLVVGAVDGVFYTFGGRDRNINSHTDAVFAFDPEQGAWSPRAPMPTSRGGHAAAVLDGRIYVFGGEGNVEHPSGVFDSSEVYDPVADRWANLAPMLTRRHGTGAVAVDGRIFVPGGADVQAFAAVATVEFFTP